MSSSLTHPFAAHRLARLLTPCAVVLLAACAGSADRAAPAASPAPSAAPAPVGVPSGATKPAPAPSAMTAAARPSAAAADPWATPSAAHLPVAAVRNVPETFFGTRVDDPYRWLEDAKAPESAAWMKAHSEHAHAVLKRIAGRDGLRKRFDELDASTPARVHSVIKLPSGRHFYESRGVKDDQFKLMVRDGLTGAERLVFDPETLRKATGKPHAINYYQPSNNGRLVAIGVSADGSEDASLRVLEVDTGRQLGAEISRANWGGVQWTPDDSELWFQRLQELKPGMPATEKFQRSTLVRMKPGAAERDLVVAARHDDPAAPFKASEFPFAEILPDGRVVLIIHDGVSPHYGAWHSTVDKVRAGKPAWKRLFTQDDGITSFVVKGPMAFALTFKGAPRLKLVAGPLEGFDPARAREVMPASQRVLVSLAAAQDALYVKVRDGNANRLLRLAHGAAGAAQEVPLPVLGSFDFTGTPRTDVPGVMIELQGWVRARQIMQVAPGGAVQNTGLQPAGPHDAPQDLVSTEVMVRSHDGVDVPMSIIHKRGVVLDGKNPTLLYGYASYGMTEEPFYSPSRRVWTENGGVFAVANPRGSGVFGRQWHLDGKEATKRNTWLDFIACAEYLVQQRWTQPSKLGIWGGSAGGILVGRAMTTRPELFAAVVPEVGSLEMVRAEVTPNGVPNIPEFGTRANEKGFRALLEMSTYHQVRDGVKYPAVLFTHGVNDPRVEVWETTKTAARVMAASASGKPVLMRLDYSAGHGIGNTKAQQFDERADVFAFLLWQMGVPGFGLKP